MAKKLQADVRQIFITSVLSLLSKDHCHFRTRCSGCRGVSGCMHWPLIQYVSPSVLQGSVSRQLNSLRNAVPGTLSSRRGKRSLCSNETRRKPWLRHISTQKSRVLSVFFHEIEVSPLDKNLHGNHHSVSANHTIF